jgi:hypothetical protein
MTREQLVIAEAVTMADARRMAESLRAQSHDEGNARIGAELQGVAEQPDPAVAT